MKKLLSRNEEFMLLAVRRLGADAYSSSIRDLLKEDTGRSFSYGSIFVSLEKLEQNGLVTSTMSEPEPVPGGRSRRVYTITPRGERALEDALRVHASMWAGQAEAIRGTRR